MDGFVGAQRSGRTDASARVQAKSRHDAMRREAASVGDESIAHVDCDTIPYLWMYASRFALFDSFFQGARAPSSPSNVEIIAAQNGETEYKRYGAAGPPYTARAAGRGRPRRPDVRRSRSGVGPVQRRGFQQEHQVDQTYATVLLNLEGANVEPLTHYTHDIGDDIAFLRARSEAPVSWTWYQQGYANPADPGPPTARHAPSRAALFRLHREQLVDGRPHRRHHALCDGRCRRMSSATAASST